MPRGLPKLPIEQHIAETGGDRRAVYERKMRNEGNRKVTVWVPEVVSAKVRDLCSCLVHAPDAAAFLSEIDALTAQVRSSTSEISGDGA